jgi:hypothetical protein
MLIEFARRGTAEKSMSDAAMSPRLLAIAITAPS